MFSCPTHNYFSIWHWLAIFGTCVHHHARMYHVHSGSRFDIDLWHQGQIFSFFSCLCIRHVTFAWFDIGIQYLAHWSITMKGCVLYIYDSWYDIYLWPQVKFIGFMTWLCVHATYFFVLSHSHTMWVYHHGTMCRVHPWPLYDLDRWSRYQIIFSSWIWDLQDCLCSLT